MIRLRIIHSVNVSYILTNYPYFDKFEFDIFDAGWSSVPLYHICRHCS